MQDRNIPTARDRSNLKSNKARLRNFEKENYWRQLSEELCCIYKLILGYLMCALYFELLALCSIRSILVCVSQLLDVSSSSTGRCRMLIEDFCCAYCTFSWGIPADFKIIVFYSIIRPLINVYVRTFLIHLVWHLTWCVNKIEVLKCWILNVNNILDAAIPSQRSDRTNLIIRTDFKIWWCYPLHLIIIDTRMGKVKVFC